MSKLIPQTFIDDLLSRIDIAETVGSRVKLRRAGSNLVGLCPFHTEKTPSFTVSQNKQFFHCFGCGAHGSAISFIMQFEHLSFVEAVENLATQIGLAVPKTAGSDNQARYTELYKATEKAATFFEQQLPRATKCIDYLKSRGFTGIICKKFRVGYAPNDWENLQPLYSSSQQLIDAGLLITKNNKTYSRFRDRIMFPIRNVRGHIIGFGGRTLSNDLAKYLNSPETKIFHKGEELYGLYEAKKTNPNLNSIIVVEGYLDVVSLAQFGITNVVAALGTAISSKQVQLLLRNTSEIVFCFDGDKAGRTAAWRALENSLPLMRDGIQIKFLFLPEGYDPDSLIKKELKEAFIKRMGTATPLADFFFKQLSSDINVNTIDGRGKLAKIGIEWLKKMPYSIFRQLMLDKIAQIANVDVEELKNLELSQPSIRNAQKSNETDTKSNADISIVVQNAINILLHHPQLVVCDDNIERIKNINLDGMKLLSELLSLLKKQPNLSMAAILEYWRDREEFDTFSMLACKKPVISMENLKNEFIGIIQLLEQLEHEQLIKTLLLKATTQGFTTEERQELQNLIAASKNKKQA
jgi:DNA primase